MKAFKFTKPQTQIIKNQSRFIIVSAGRRFGKSVLAIEKMLQEASTPDKRIWYIAPTYKQAKNIAWVMLKKRLQQLNWVQKINEVELEIELINGSLISLKGANNPDSLRGVGVHFMVIDEAASIDEMTWVLVLRPMLADTKGGGWFIGTPKGTNWFYHMYHRGLDINETNYQAYHFTTLEGGNVTQEEIEEAKQDMDQLSYEQEFEASFINYYGKAYYTFTYDDHVKRLGYNNENELILCFDFNINPGVAVIIQEQPLFTYKANKLSPIQQIYGTGIINEIYIPSNSTTLNVCNKIIELYRNHKGKVICYGDATGAAGGSAKIQGSDWDIIKNILYPVFQNRLYFRVPNSNPRERVRVNAVNSRMKNSEGFIRMLVDPRCKHLIQDLDGVTVLDGGSGEIDKKSNPNLTHLSDALGYYIVSEFPITTLDKSKPFTINGRY